MFKKTLILILMLFLMNSKCLADGSIEQICDNVQYFTSRICHNWGDLCKNFKDLEQNLKYLDGIIVKEDIKDLKQQGIKYFTSHDDRITAKIAIKKLNALVDAMGDYIDKSGSYCCQNMANGKTLMKLYFKNLKKYN